MRRAKYVTLTDEDLEQFESKTSKSIEIAQFVDQSTIDPIYFEKAYYLGPEENAKAAYALLAEALTKSSKVALARMVFHDKEYLALVRPVNNMLVLTTMHFPEEIRKPEGIGIPAADTQLGEKEQEMAEMLVKHDELGVRPGPIPRYSPRRAAGNDSRQGRGPGSGPRAGKASADQRNRYNVPAEGEYRAGGTRESSPSGLITSEDAFISRPALLLVYPTFQGIELPQNEMSKPGRTDRFVAGRIGTMSVL